MNAHEALILVRRVAAQCPAQRFDDLAPEAWAESMPEVRLADALAVIGRLAREHEFIGPAAIVPAVRRLRNDRMSHAEPPVPPAGLSVAEDVEWMRDAWRRIGDGETVQSNRGELKPRPHVRSLVRTME